MNYLLTKSGAADPGRRSGRAVHPPRRQAVRPRAGALRDGEAVPEQSRHLRVRLEALLRVVGQGRAAPEGGRPQVAARWRRDRARRRRASARVRGAPCRAMLPLVSGVTAFMVVYPLAMVLYGSVRDAAPGQPGAFTLAHWRAVLSDASTFRVLAEQHADRAAPHDAGARPRHRVRLVHRPHDHAGQAAARRPAGVPVLPAGAAVGARVDAARRAERGPAQPVAARDRPRRGIVRQRLLVRGRSSCSAPCARRRCCSCSSTPRSRPWTPRWKKPRAWPGPARWRTLWRDQPAAAAAGAARLGHPLLRGGHGVVRDPPAPRHAGQDLRVHDPDLRPRLRRPRGALRPRHGARRAVAAAHGQPHRRAVEDPEGPRLHDGLRPRLSGAAARPRALALGAVRVHRRLLRWCSARCRSRCCC